MILVKSNNQYVTKKNFNSDFSLTNNINFAYVFENTKQAEYFIKWYSDKFQNLIIEEE